MSHGFKFTAYEKDVLIAVGNFENRKKMIFITTEYICNILRYLKIENGTDEDIITKHIDELNKLFKKGEILLYGDIKFQIDKIIFDNEFHILKDFLEKESNEEQNIKIRLKKTGDDIKYVNLEYKTGLINI